VTKYEGDSELCSFLVLLLAIRFGADEIQTDRPTDSSNFTKLAQMQIVIYRQINHAYAMFLKSDAYFRRIYAFLFRHAS